MSDFTARRKVLAARIEHASIVASRLYATEHAIDAVLAEGSRLMASLAEARQVCGIAAQDSHDIYRHTSASIANIVAASEEIIEAHKSLANAARRFSIDTTAVGPFEEKAAAHPSTGLVAVA